MKRTVLLTIMLAIVACTLQAQQRDRRVDLEVRCIKNACVSSTGEIWMVTRCGEIYYAEGFDSVWHTARINAEGIFRNNPTLDRVACFGNNTVVAAGFIPDEGVHNYDFVLRTVDGGRHWDTVHFASGGHHWIDGFSFRADGRLWMGSNSGRIVYSTDSGRTFTNLNDTALHLNVNDICMVTADSGWIADHGNRIFSTSDNWHTLHRWPTPFAQGLGEPKGKHDRKPVTIIRPWREYLLTIEAGRSYISPLGDSIRWRPTRQPLVDFDVDTLTGNLWAITDSGQLLYHKDMDNIQVIREGLSSGYRKICGIHGGRICLLTDRGVVRIAPDGRADTCGFYTEEQTLEEVFDSVARERGEYVSEALPTFTHGGRIWRSDGNSIYMQDALGWYRIAKPLGIRRMLPDPDRDDRIVILCYNNKNYSVDTAGRIEPYTYCQPLASFVESGLKGVIIRTYVSGCFHYDEQVVAYAREGDFLRECENTVDSNRWVTRSVVADSLERTLMLLGEKYSQFPSPRDFGLEEGDVDLEKVYLTDHGWCTSGSGYDIVFINRRGDTLIARGHSNVNCGKFFPWMLPMTFMGDSAAFVTYQPMLWMSLLPLMPEGMMHRGFLSNCTLVGLRPGDLLFFTDSKGMGRAIKESTGNYTHVAIVESTIRDTVWVIDATPEEGVARRPLLYRRGFLPDAYRLNKDIWNVEIDSVLNRARSFIGQPYDRAFLPDNGALYCSELVYECYMASGGHHLFEAKPMNWRNAKGRLPRYWKKHFRKLKMRVPEGVLGTNPTDLSRSPLLHKL